MDLVKVCARSMPGAIRQTARKKLAESQSPPGILLISLLTQQIHLRSCNIHQAPKRSLNIGPTAVIVAMPLKQKFALVTGWLPFQFLGLQSFTDVFRCGQGGIGEALVNEYTRSGVHAIATVLPQENSDHLTEAGISWFPLDVTVEKSVVDLKQKVLALTGGDLDILVNCA